MFEEQLTGKNVLVVDDDTSLRRTVVELLEIAGLSVVSSPNAPLGLQFADKQRFDLILTDLMMPEMDGYTFIAELKKKPNTSAIPVIVVTGKADPAGSEESTRHGAAAYLVKPFSVEGLLRLVQKCLRDTPPSN